MHLTFKCILHYGTSVPNSNIHLSYRHLQQQQKRRGKFSMGMNSIYFGKERNTVSALTVLGKSKTKFVNSPISLHDVSHERVLLHFMYSP